MNNKEQNLIEAQSDLEKIEYKNRTWKSDFMRNQSIWDEIAMQINSYTGAKKAHWVRVMKLHLSKRK